MSAGEFTKDYREGFWLDVYKVKPEWLFAGDYLCILSRVSLCGMLDATAVTNCLTVTGLIKDELNGCYYFVPLMLMTTNLTLIRRDFDEYQLPNVQSKSQCYIHIMYEKKCYI